MCVVYLNSHAQWYSVSHVYNPRCLKNEWTFTFGITSSMTTLAAHVTIKKTQPIEFNR